MSLPMLQLIYLQLINLFYTSCINPISLVEYKLQKLIKGANATSLLCITLIISFHYFSSFVIRQYHTPVGCHAIGINSLSLSLHALRCFLSHKPNMNNSFRIIFIKIIIIKVKVFKFYSYSKKTHILTKECNSTRVYIIKVYIIRENKIIQFSSILFVTNESKANFDVGRQTLAALSHISF